MVWIEIDRDNPRRPGGKIVEDIASARRDRDEAVMGLKRQRVEVDPGLFPYLVVDKSLEHEREQPVQDAALGGQGSVMSGTLEKDIAHMAEIRRSPRV